jgi:hypothetical protein
MARPVRKKLKFDEDSVNKLLQEVYDESHNIKAKIARLYTKWEIKVKENSDVAGIGDQIIKLIAAEAKNQDQKIMLLRYLKEVVFENKSPDGMPNLKQAQGETGGDVPDSRRNELLSWVEETVNKKDREKK